MQLGPRASSPGCTLRRVRKLWREVHFFYLHDPFADKGERWILNFSLLHRPSNRFSAYWNWFGTLQKVHQLPDLFHTQRGKFIFHGSLLFSVILLPHCIFNWCKYYDMTLTLHNFTIDCHFILNALGWVVSCAPEYVRQIRIVCDQI